MSLRSIFSQRRYRRLSLALFAAFTVHLGIGVSGNWGILLFSAPSNQDRTLTLSLENTTYEGLKEEAKQEDTLNDAALGEAKTAKSELVNDVDRQVREVEPIETVKPIAPTLAAEQPPSELLEMPDLNQLEPQVSEQQAGRSEIVPELISANDVSEVKVNDSARQSEADAITPEPLPTVLNSTEHQMLTKKVKRWSSKVLKNVESQEPLEWEKNGQKYVASFKKLPADGDMDTDEVVIEVATNRDGKNLTTSLRLKKMAFSNFAQFVHQWDEQVSIHDDEMNGRFHSNTKFNVVANRKVSPLFHGKVTTASYFVDIDGRVPRKKIFLAGLETGVKRIAMPKPSVLFDSAKFDKTIASKLISQDSRIIFNRDGSYLVQPHKEVGVMRRYHIGEQPLYILAAPGVSLSLIGTVNGAVAVYSPKRITIDGNLEYASTEGIEEGGDFLGLISGRSVVVADRDIVPSGDLNIQAAIYAKSRFEVRQLRGKPAGTLNVLGSVSAGSITATEPRYATNIVFDTRLENLRPPGFPVTDRYELLARQNSWQLEDDPYYEALNQDELENPPLEHGDL